MQKIAFQGLKFSKFFRGRHVHGPLEVTACHRQAGARRIVPNLTNFQNRKLEGL